MYSDACGVLEILDANTTMDETTVMPFLVVANRIVTDNLTNKGIAADTLREIERWLAAHCIAMSDRETGIAKERIGDNTEVTYSGKTGMGLTATRYGQMAISIDPSKTLAVVGKNKIAFEVLDTVDGGS